VVSEHALPDANCGPGSIVAGPDGNLWFTEIQGHRVGRMTPDGFVSEYEVKDSYGQFLSALVAGPQHALWFTDASGFTSPYERPPDFIGRVVLGGAVTLFPLPTRNASPRGIVAGPDGNLWFTEASPEVSRIGRLTSTGDLTEYTLPTSATEPADIAVGPGGTLWLTESAADRIARLLSASSLAP
jgi:streptogramin lyase